MKALIRRYINPCYGCGKEPCTCTATRSEGIEIILNREFPEGM